MKTKEIIDIEKVIAEKKEMQEEYLRKNRCLSLVLEILIEHFEEERAK